MAINNLLRTVKDYRRAEQAALVLEPASAAALPGPASASAWGPAGSLNLPPAPGARLAVIPGGGHSPQFEAPERWWEAVTAFLAEAGL